ncbi:MAG: replicative DNA helicase [Chitinophagales bacterium]|nr:replicative DNA helicase [Chitinophagales bacterium]OJV25490.1 MAG: replicative DNA helicase [Bacteroidetes bacterium 37-13]
MSDPQDIIKQTRDSIRKSKLLLSDSQNVLDYGKMPPQAVDLEEAVLGAVMIERDAINEVSDILKEESFYVDKNQRIWRAIRALDQKQMPIDLLTVTEQLKKQGDLDMAGGPFYVAQLTNKVASAANVKAHAHIIAEKLIQRQLISTSTEVIKEAYSDTSDVFELLDKAEKNLFSIAESNLKRSSENISDILLSELKELDIRMNNSQDNLNGVPSGFIDLDKATGGWQRSDFIIVAARPAMGKTAFTLALARNAAVDHKKPVAIFSLEMSNAQLVQRLISMETHIAADKIRRGNLEEYEYQILTSKIDGLRNAQLFIDDTPAINVFELRSKCRRLKQQHNIEMVIIDYLQLMSGTNEGKGGGNREQEISQISRSLKGLAKELNIPVIALSQLSRAPEKRGGPPKPVLSDLRESGAIEQDADIVIFLYRPEYYKIPTFDDGTPTEGIAEVLISKHRNGPVIDVRTRFIGKFAKFENLNSFSAIDEYGAISKEKQKQNFITAQSKINKEEEDDFEFKRKHKSEDFSSDSDGPPF